jgi:hypothetical protein
VPAQRNKTLFLYNDTKPSKDQEWDVFAEGVLHHKDTVGSARKSFKISLKGDVTIQFGVDDTVYLKATYNHSNDSWTHHTDTPNEMQFSASGDAVTVKSSYQHAPVAHQPAQGHSSASPTRTSTPASLTPGPAPSRHSTARR